MHLKRTLFILALTATAGAADAPRPNIIYLLADDLGIGDLSSYGQQTLRTPQIDRLAERGMRFTEHYAGNPCCAPSRSSFITGRHTGRVRHRDNRRFVHSYGFRPEDVTVAEVMKDAGYATGLAGKWHLGDRSDTKDMAHHHGFDFSYSQGFPYPEGGREHWPSHIFVNGVRRAVPENAGGAKGRWMDDLYTDAAIGFVHENRARPFFLLLSFQGVHAPMDGKISPRFAERDWPEPEKVFASMLEQLDDNVGRLVATLRELGLEETTAIFFASDNGPHNESGHASSFFRSGGPWRGAKFQYYEGGVRVPLIAVWPGKIAPATTTNHVCATWDLLPTFAEMGKAAAPAEIDGISMVPTLLGEGARQRRHDYLYWEGQENRGTQAIRTGNWKAIRQGVSRDEQAAFALYDLATDPREERNRAAEFPEVVRRMEAIAQEAHVRSFETPLFARERDGARIPPEGSFTVGEVP